MECIAYIVSTECNRQPLAMAGNKKNNGFSSQRVGDEEVIACCDSLTLIEEPKKLWSDYNLRNAIEASSLEKRHVNASFWTHEMFC